MKTRILMALMLVSCSAASPAAQDKGGFDAAKADPAKRPAYLKTLLDPLLHDASRNPEGLIGSWSPAAESRDTLLAAYKAAKQEYYFEEKFKTILATVNGTPVRFHPFFAPGTYPAEQSHAALLVVGDLFALAGEDEVRSALEDYALTYVRLWDNGLAVKDKDIDLAIPALGDQSDFLPVRILSLTAQIKGILGGTRTVSDPFRAQAEKFFLDTYAEYRRKLVAEQKVFADNNENFFQKEIVEALTLVLASVDEQLAELGYAVSESAEGFALKKK